MHKISIAMTSFILLMAYLGNSSASFFFTYQPKKPKEIIKIDRIGKFQHKN